MNDDNYRMEIAFDVIPLPSEGVFYANKKDSIKVSYLTATDENILTSQNLIKSGKVIDELLRAKILDKDITVEELHESDKEAILLWLRNTAYGSMITLVVTDPDTSEQVEVEYDLQNVKYKKLTISSDSEGLFEYKLSSGKDIKFRFLNTKDLEELNQMDDLYKDMVIKPTITKRLEKMIIDVDGERDPMKLSHIIQFLPIKDSQHFRRFVSDNTPGLNKEVELILPSGKKIQTFFGFGPEFFRPFYGL